MVERYSIYWEGDTNSKDESTNSNNNKEEEDLLLEKKSKSSSKDANTLLYGRLTKVEEENLAREIQQATILDTR
jgi:hypothetical protein